MIYKVRYSAGTYEGDRIVTAQDRDTAIAKVRAWVRKSTAMPMFAEHYEVIGEYEG